ncbi:carbon-nitrogen hydrolase family protein [Nitrosophilus labii]|uniref:carbon-nitrogen hydrolase family protein n=1 Tax=Nitrosophilus labii TaxID=2706014 RepID=UPI001656FC49|nr:carbon-nitrogen hydrolase family protein [Nitrosophilus labii]
MKVAVLQTAYLGMSSNRLDYYLRACKLKDVKLLLLGEYVLNRFFKELEKTPLSMIKEQSLHQIKNLKELAKKYELTIVAPLVTIQKEKAYKNVAIFFPKKTQYYLQQILIDYKHWNEKKFFANPTDCLKPPITFMIDGVKFGVIGGFELHFNYFFDQFSKKNVDVVLLPTVSTFESNQRWREILKTRAYLGNHYILRANRIGEYLDKKTKWNFYGESMCVDPNGKIESILTDKEELLICDIDKEYIKECKKAWGFRATVNGRTICE